MNEEYKRFTVIDRYGEDEYFLLVTEDGVNINSVKDEDGRVLLFNSQRAAKIQATKRNLVVLKFDEFFEKLKTENLDIPKSNTLEVYKALYSSMFVEHSILEMWDGCFCLAKNENLYGGYYDNKDNSLKYLTQNRNLLPFFQGEHFSVSQNDLLKLTSYTKEDFDEYSKLCETELSALTKIYEPTFMGQVFVNYNALIRLSKTSISASSYAKLLDLKTKDCSYMALSELAAEKGLWNFAATEINRIMNNRIPAVKVLFDSGEYLFMIPPESIDIFIPNRDLAKLEEYKVMPDESIQEVAQEGSKPGDSPNKGVNPQAIAFLNRLISDAKDLISFGKVHEKECVEIYEKYLKKLEFFKTEYESLGVLDIKSIPKIEDYLKNLELNWREEKHSKLSKEIERLLSKNEEK